jgi:tetratricopeptide (TPR) repeat protein
MPDTQRAMPDMSLQATLTHGALRRSPILRAWVIFSIIWLCSLGIPVLPFFLDVFNARWAEAEDSTSPEILLSNGSQAFRRGAFAEAIRHWQEAARLYEGADKLQERSVALISLAQAYQALGQYTAAKQLLDTAETLAKQTYDQKHVALAQSG